MSRYSITKKPGFFTESKGLEIDAKCNEAAKSATPSQKVDIKACPPLDVLDAMFELNTIEGVLLNKKSRGGLALKAECGTRNTSYVTVYARQRGELALFDYRLIDVRCAA